MARSPSIALRIALVAAVVTLAPGCGGAAPAPSTPSAAKAGKPSKSSKPGKPGKAAVKVGEVSTGLASYYADSLAGRPTASGEPYDPGELTAAHRTLPFGTLVEVARDGGRTVVVRINDRGPFGKKKRLIDLSRRAAEELGMVRAGVVSVTVRVVAGPSSR